MKDGERHYAVAIIRVHLAFRTWRKVESSTCSCA